MPRIHSTRTKKLIMRKKILLCALLLLPLSSQTLQAAATTKSSGDLSWTVQTQWSLPTKPKAVVQSLDDKKVFILGEDAKVYIYTPQGKKLGELPVDPGVNALDIEPRGSMLYLVNEDKKTYQAIEISFHQEIDITGAPIQGDPDAPVTLVVFSDFECPWCGKTEPVLKQLLKNNKGTLRIVFKHLPLQMHPFAEKAALAAIAAQRQDKFWEMHDALFALKKWSDNAIAKEAEKLGLDMEQFRKDFNSQDTRLQLAKDLNDAQNADVSATPSLFINGQPVKERSLPAMQKMIKAALAKQGGKK